MPAINVARTDTFEIQRQKINQIGEQIFNISAGGSDLATGNLKLGDGTKTVPSLSFTSDGTLGLYKPQAKSVGFVSGSKRILDIREEAFVSFKDILIQNKVLSTDGISISNPGQNYDAGAFSNVPFSGGTGLGATANIIVTSFLGTITQLGSDYAPGNFSVLLEGGNGSGAVAVFSVQGIEGSVNNPGSGYVPNVYTSVNLINGSGSGAQADITVIGSSSFNGSITNGGSGYAGADGVYVDISLTNGSGTGATADITLTGGSVTDITITGFGSGYVVTDILSVDPASLAGDNAAAGSGFAYTISSLQYNGTVDSVIITNQGTGYVVGDVLSASDSDLGGAGGSGFAFTISSQPGLIQNLEFSDKGSGYQVGDLLNLPGPQTGVATNLNAQLSGVSATLDVASTTVVVSSTTGIVAGMIVGSSGGEVDENTTVVSVDSATEITIDINPLASGSVSLTFTSPNPFDQIVVADSSPIIVGSTVIQTAGSGQLDADTVVVSVDNTTNTITISPIPLTAGTATLTFNPPYGVPTSDFQYRIDTLGSIESFTIADGGSGYDVNDVLTVSPSDLSTPITKVVTTVGVEVIVPVETIPSGTFSVGDTLSISGGESGTANAEVYEISLSGGNIASMTLESVGVSDGATFSKAGSSTYTVSTLTTESRFAIDGSLLADLTLYAGDVYDFDISDASNAPTSFSFSEYADGVYSPSLIENIIATLDTSTTTVSVNSTSGILPGMIVSVSSGSGQVVAGTKVASITNATTLVLDTIPLGSGNAVLSFVGFEYTDNVSRSPTNLVIKITNDTPSTLYYYDANSPNGGGSDGVEAQLTIDANNPRVFGSGAEFTVLSITNTDVIVADVESGQLTSISSVGESLNFDSGEIDTFTSVSSKAETLTVTNIISDADGDDKIDITSGSDVNIVSQNVNIGSSIQFNNSTGNITTSGTLKSTNKISSNAKLEISENVISVVPGQDLEFTISSTTNQTIINSSSALVIPSGDTSQRPSLADSLNGAIRFNTQTNSYEGYSQTNGTWSSLGGVRDLDGNTTILAEESVGANDNTLWFINDNVNTVRFTPQYQEFVNVKKIRSVNVSAPDYDIWRANAQVSLGEYLKYRNNIYEVTVAGTTGTSGDEPVHTSGAVTNGTAELTFFVTAVSSLTFEEISEVRIDPLGFTDLVVNNELRFSGNVISSNTNDIFIEPNAGQKVKIVAPTSLVLPVGDNNSKGNPERGSVRYNTDDLQFEGFNGAQWGGLGGVKDIDQDTYIIPETSPNADEDILYFYNGNVNTLQLNTTKLEFRGIDTLESSISNEFNFDASIIAFDFLATVLDNTSTTSSFLYTTKEHLDLGLSAGLTTDSLLKLTDQGDIYFNLGFGTGVYNGVKVFDSELKELEIADYKVVTKKVDLDRGTVNSGDAILYDPATQVSARVYLTAHNTTTGDKEFIEYSVIDNGTDIFYTEIGNIVTGEPLVDSAFDFNASNQVRLTFTLNTALTTGDDVEVTVVSNITKR